MYIYKKNVLNGCTKILKQHRKKSGSRFNKLAYKEQKLKKGKIRNTKKPNQQYNRYDHCSIYLQRKKYQITPKPNKKLIFR